MASPRFICRLEAPREQRTLSTQEQSKNLQFFSDSCGDDMHGRLGVKALLC